jgi:hypothetical protein
MVEEMAAAAASLNSQAQQLVTTVSIFTLNESASPGGGNTAALLPARTRKVERAEGRPVLAGPAFSA